MQGPAPDDEKDGPVEEKEYEVGQEVTESSQRKFIEDSVVAEDSGGITGIAPPVMPAMKGWDHHDEHGLSAPRQSRT